MNTINVAKLVPEAKLPSRKHAADAGLDLFTLEDVTVNPFDHAIVRTGIAIDIPIGFYGQIMPKSRNNHLVGAGVVDPGYKGEILVKIVNFECNRVFIRPGDAIAQIIIIPIETPIPLEVPINEILEIETDRGATGGIVNQITYPEKGE